jgi:tetratricopeptide (TPR) repeat protein
LLTVLAKNGQNFTNLGETEQIIVSVTLRSAQACAPYQVTGGTMTGASVTSDAGLTGSIILNERYSSAFIPGNSVQQQTPLQEDVLKLDAAKADFQKQVLLGDLHMKQGQNEQAATAFEAALKVYDDSLQLQRRRSLDPKETPEAEAQMVKVYRLTAAKLLQAYAALGKQQEMQQMLKKLDAQMGKAPATDGGGSKPPAPTLQKQELPAKLVISAPKKLLEMAGSGKITFEEFRKNATVDYQPPKTIDKQPAKPPATE